MRNLLSVTALAVALILFFAVNVLSSTALRTVRLDLTEDRLYTLTDGSRRIARAIDEPVRLRLYLSEKLATDVGFQGYGTRVKEMLAEFALHSRGRLRLEFVDPEPFSEAEDDAQQAGITPATIDAGEGFYFGLVGTSSTDAEEIVNWSGQVYDRTRERLERFLEYEIAHLVYTLSHPDKPVIGLVTKVPLEGSPMSGFPGSPPGAGKPWLITAELQKQFELKSLGTDFKDIPADVDLLWIVHPQGLSQPTLFAIDQYVLKGGKAFVQVDPLFERDTPRNPQDPMAGIRAELSSDLGPLLAAWGLKLVDGKVLGDRKNAIEQSFYGPGGRIEQAPYVCWIGLTSENFEADDPTVSGLRTLILPTPGALQVVEGAGTTVTPLASSSTESMQIDSFKLRMFARPNELLAEFVPELEAYPIAARITGTAKTAFPDGPPADDASAGEDGAPEAPAAPAAREWQRESSGSINVVVVADVDFLTDDFWMRESRLGNLLIGYNRLSDNGDFVINVMDNMTGSADLISVRGRKPFSRPFERVQELERHSKEQYAAEKQELQEELEAANRRLTELQREKPQDQRMTLSPEQEGEIERWEQKQLETRKQLRAVNYNLNKDIERLGTRLKWLNIGLVPALVAAAALTLGTARVRRRRR